MIASVLLGYDGSESADKALVFAVGLARAFKAELHVLGVVRPPDFDGDVETRAIVENARNHFEGLLQAARAKLAKERLRTHFDLAVGHPAECIVTYAEKKGIEHIVVGHRGQSLFGRWLVGSVARQVIEHSPCAVTVVRK